MDNIEAKLRQYQPQMLSIFRIMVGLLLLQHGTVKWFGIPAPNAAFANITLVSMFGIAGIIELVCGTLLTVGLFTRAAALILSGEMAVAYFIYANRLARGLTPIVNGGELEVLFCFAFLLLVFTGGGAWSLDQKLRNRD